MVYQTSWVIYSEIHPWRTAVYYLTLNKGVHMFPKSVSVKVNLIARLEFKLTYFEATIQYFSHYSMRTLTVNLLSLGKE